MWCDDCVSSHLNEKTWKPKNLNNDVLRYISLRSGTMIITFPFYDWAMCSKAIEPHIVEFLICENKMKLKILKLFHGNSVTDMNRQTDNQNK